MVFYVPGACCVAWSLLYWAFCSNTPEDHPRISKEEKDYLVENAFKGREEYSEAKKGVPWSQLLTSVPLYATIVAHLSGGWLFYLMAVNLPNFVNEVFNVGIIEVL